MYRHCYVEEARKEKGEGRVLVSWSSLVLPSYGKGEEFDKGNLAPYTCTWRDT
jgi:hypothetical protein